MPYIRLLQRELFKILCVLFVALQLFMRFAPLEPLENLTQISLVFGINFKIITASTGVRQRGLEPSRARASCEDPFQQVQLPLLRQSLLL